VGARYSAERRFFAAEMRQKNREIRWYHGAAPSFAEDGAAFAVERLFLRISRRGADNGSEKQENKKQETRKQKAPASRARPVREQGKPYQSPGSAAKQRNQ